MKILQELITFSLFENTGFESILEGLYGPRLRRDLSLFEGNSHFKKYLKLQPPTLFNKVVLSKLYIKHNFMITFNLTIFKIK